MKRLTAILIALMLLCAAAQAEGLQAIESDKEITCDLDGDGAMERVSWKKVAPDGDYDPVVVLMVAPDGGEPASFETEIVWGESVNLVKLIDGDSATDIMISGDVMSDDYVTYYLRWKDGALYPLLFADGGRGENGDGCYYEVGIGRFTEIGPNRLTLSGSQDVLGTWFAKRSYALNPVGYFDFDDDGLWVRDIDDADGEVWDYGALTLKTELAYTDENGDAGTLAAGEKILVTASDKKNLAWFATRDGRTGTLEIGLDYDKGWGWLVNGVSEDDAFEYVPYAD